MSAAANRRRILTLLCQDRGIRITTHSGLVFEATDALDVVVGPRFVRIGDDAGVGFAAISRIEAL